jgi:pseudouridine-5'-phosphate glycosidase
VTTTKFRIADRVSQALAAGEPVVALESTVIAHGLPQPLNIETARACEDAIRKHGATPATVGVVNGSPTIGLSDDELAVFAQRDPSMKITKVSLNNLAGVMRQGSWGATTVAASLRIANSAGLRVFSTGGIGGVHRGASKSFDVSADLTALASNPTICVCAGAKAILDLPKTLELLESLGVPVVGYRTTEFPAFYSRHSGLGVDVTVQTNDEIAELALDHWSFGGSGAVLLCVPIPEESAIAANEIELATEQAIARADEIKISGKAVTPFLLAELEKFTGGRTLIANRALLINNAAVAAGVATSLARKVKTKR